MKNAKARKLRVMPPSEIKDDNAFANEFDGFVKVTANKTLKPLEVIPDRTEKC